MVRSTSLADVLRSGPEEYDLQAALAKARSEYPALAKYPVTVQRYTGGDRPGYLEFYPPWEERNPNPGTITVEVYKPMRGELLSRAIAGDLAHMAGAVDPRTGKPVDPAFYALKRQFATTLTPEQLAVDRRAHQDEGDPRPFEDWHEQSRLDAYLRGWIFPDERDEWRRQGVYTPEQTKLLQRMQRYLRGGQ